MPQEEFEKALVDITQDPDLGRAVRIIWIDSGLHRDRGWAPREEFLESDFHVLEVETVGLWMGESDTAISIGQSRDAHNDNWIAAQIIYKPCIVRKEWLL